MMEKQDQEAAMGTERPETEEASREEELRARCEETICPECRVMADAEDVRLRALAEMDNFRKRLLREKEEQLKYAAEEVLADLLPALDSLDLAVRYGTCNEACKDMATGVAMTRKLFWDALKQHGLVPVGEAGEPFDPEIHEAVSYEDREDIDEGLVSTLHQRGYRLKERLLRPAKVSVSRKPV